MNSPAGSAAPPAPPAVCGRHESTPAVQVHPAPQQQPKNLPVKRSKAPRVIIRTPPQRPPGEQKNRKDNGKKLDRRKGR